MVKNSKFYVDRLLHFLGGSISISQILWNEVRPAKLKFKRGLRSKNCKINGNIDLKFYKIASKTICQIVYKSSSMQAK